MTLLTIYKPFSSCLSRLGMDAQIFTYLYSQISIVRDMFIDDTPVMICQYVNRGIICVHTFIYISVYMCVKENNECFLPKFTIITLVDKFLSSSAKGPYLCYFYE